MVKFTHLIHNIKEALKMDSSMALAYKYFQMATNTTDYMLMESHREMVFITGKMEPFTKGSLKME